MALTLTPLEFLDHLAAPIPPPRKHRYRNHGVLAPHAPLRPAVTAYAGLQMVAPAGPPQSPAPPPDPTEPAGCSQARYLWAVLIARIYAVLPLICPVCGRAMRLIAAVTGPEPVRRILRHVGEPTAPPPVSPARSPPLWHSVDWNQTPVAAPEHGQPAPEFPFDQTVSW
jgi:hypothetical protein